MAWQKMAQALALRRYRRRAARGSNALSFSALLQEAQRVLVCLPEQAAEYDRLVSALAEIRKTFPKAQVTLVQNGAIPVSTEMARGFQLIVWGPADLDRSGGPNSACKKRIFNTPYDVAVDLNRAVHFFSLALVMESGAPVRAGFADPAREEYYSFLFRSGSPDPLRAFSGLLAYLGRPKAVPSPLTAC